MFFKLALTKNATDASDASLWNCPTGMKMLSLSHFLLELREFCVVGLNVTALVHDSST